MSKILAIFKSICAILYDFVVLIMIMNKIKNILYNLIAFAIGTVILLLIVEILLNFYNPFAYRLKGDKIILASNISWKFDNKNIHGLDSVIIHSKNSIGFRGPNPPSNFEEWTSIVAVGGSTTECFYLSDGNDWPAILSQKLKKEFSNVWINNAGLDGHSSFGHQILLKDFIVKLKPNFVMFLVGCNDIERSDLNEFDDSVLKKTGSWKSFIRNNTEVVSLFLNIKRSFVAKSMGIIHNSIDIESADFIDSIDTNLIKQTIKKQEKYQKKYSERLKNVINFCKQNGIIPVFITQPTLVGSGFDDVTNINLEKIKYCDSFGGKIYWEKLKVYNNTTRRIAEKEEVFLIDLASLMPKSSQYFYDCVHFTNLGAIKVAEIIYSRFKECLVYYTEQVENKNKNL